MKEEKEMPTLEHVQSMVAKKYGLGEKLVTGHAKKYFDEASIEFAKLHIKRALEEAAKSAIITTGYDENAGHFKYVDRDFILNSYPETNIK